MIDGSFNFEATPAESVENAAEGRGPIRPTADDAAKYSMMVLDLIFIGRYGTPTAAAQ